MNAVLERPEGGNLETMIAGLDHRTNDRQIRRVLEHLYAAKLSAEEVERQADRIRRNTRMNRGTFRRLQRHAEDAARA